MSKINEKQNAQVTADNLKEFKGRSLAEETARRLMKNKGAIVGMCFLILLVIVAIASEFLFDFDKDIILVRLRTPSQPPALLTFSAVTSPAVTSLPVSCTVQDTP